MFINGQNMQNVKFFYTPMDEWHECAHYYETNLRLGKVPIPTLI